MIDSFVQRQSISHNNISKLDKTRRESEAIEVITSLEINKNLMSWLSQVEDRQINGVPTIVMEYTALIYNIKELLKQHNDSSDVLARLKKCRAKGFIDITGYHVEKEDPTWRLPKKALLGASREEVLFHQALYHSGIHGLLGSIKIILNDYIFRWRDILYMLILIATWYIPPVFTVLLGLFLGYIFSSLTEFFVHRYVAHATVKERKKFDMFGRASHYMTLLFTEHSVHHGSVSRNYTEIFAPSDTNSPDAYIKQASRKKQVEKTILKQGGLPLLQSVRDSRYGLTSSNLLRTHLFFVPSSILLSYLSHLAVQALGLQPGLIFDISLFIMSQIWITNSTIYHCYLHMTREEGLKKANPVMRLYLQTRLSDFIARSHRTHHTQGGRVNQNLTPFTDYFVKWSPISISDLINLRKQKTFY